MMSVYLYPHQMAWLKRKRDKTHLSVAELIRGAINKLIRDDPSHAEFLREWLAASKKT